MRFLEEKKSQEDGPLAEKMTRQKKCKRTRQKNKWVDRKGESNGGPDISDRGWNQTSPASLRGQWSVKPTVSLLRILFVLGFLRPVNSTWSPLVKQTLLSSWFTDLDTTQSQQTQQSQNCHCTDLQPTLRVTEYKIKTQFINSSIVRFTVMMYISNIDFGGYLHCERAKALKH